MKKIVLLAASSFLVSGALAQFATGDNTSAAEFDAILKTADRLTRALDTLPSSYSLKKYAPPPQNQLPYGTCVAWSSAYAARTISYAVKRNMTDTNSIKKYAFSPGYIYYKIKDAGDAGCEKGTSILKAMKIMDSIGVMLNQEGPVDCVPSIPQKTEQQKAMPYKIKDYLALNKTLGLITKNDIIKIKRSLTEKKPVVISMNVTESFINVPATGIWDPPPGDLGLGMNASHAMCIIGYDDKRAGGSFEVMNSWGRDWGNKGFFWLSYEQAKEKGTYAIELMDFEAGRTELSGDIEFLKWVNDDGVPLKVTRAMINTRNVPVQGNVKPDYTLYRLTETLKTGDEFKILFKTSSPCYIYIFGEDTEKKISLLFPTEASFSAAINSYNASYLLPDSTHHAVLDATKGKENFCILYSKESIDFTGLMDHIEKKKITIYQAVKEKLGTRLLDIKKVKFRDDRINFQAPSEEKSVLCFFVEMKHN